MTRAASSDVADESEQADSPAPHPGQRPGRARFHSDEFFGRQLAADDALPSPEPLLENLTRCVIEILAGARELEQISRWVTDNVYRNLLNQDRKPGTPESERLTA